MKTTDFSYFIEKYIAGEMDNVEKEWFARELSENEKLRKEVELRRKTDSIIRDQEIINLRSKLKSIEKRRAESATAGNKRRQLFNIRYAAAIAGLVILGSLAVILSDRKAGYDEIVERYYKPYEASNTVRSGNTMADSDYEMAMGYYNVRDYRNAAYYFSKVIENDPDNMQSVLLNGISNFENRNYPDAKGSFSKVISDNNNYYIDHAQWYLALCYIKTEEKLKAVEILSGIEKSKTVYSRNARKILRDLK
ncbi:MAG: tetratricopeptide repeat protein [Bacteroidales bacterium]|jgi:tetratricopeptide (TPR) repeat protein|nr:tetratricopeptide repeat protein [Bacteroidales bacterium]